MDPHRDQQWLTVGLEDGIVKQVLQVGQGGGTVRQVVLQWHQEVGHVVPVGQVVPDASVWLASLAQQEKSPYLSWDHPGNGTVLRIFSYFSQAVYQIKWPSGNGLYSKFYKTKLM